MTILEQLAAAARQRVLASSEENSKDVLRMLAAQGGIANGSAFEAALKRPGLSFICEVKRASPSKGLIARDFPYVDIARDYEAAGAHAISVLTEPTQFLGELRYLEEIAGTVKTPCLRKDFVVDEYMIYEAKCAGAAAVLLICAILDTDTIARYLELCDRLGLAALVEAHDEDEIASAVSAGAKIIGVNNRNLKDFSVDFSNAARLRDKIPAGCIYVAESGVKTPQDAAALKKIGADAALIGEALMRAPDKGRLLAALREAAR